MKLKDIANLLGGRLKGDPAFEVSGIGTTNKYKKGNIIFLYGKAEFDEFPESVALVVSEEINFPNYIIVENVKFALAKVLEALYPEHHPSGISEKAHLGRGTVLDEDIYIAPFSYIGDGVVLERGVKVYPFTYIGEGSYIGEYSIIFSGVHIYPNTIIGKRVRVHSGAVIGADGFGYHIGKDFIKKLNHIGKVIIEDDVEIGSNSCIDRALLEETKIGRGSKIDNLVQIAHNCRIGEENIIAGQTGFAGSVETGRRVIFGGQVGIADHVCIGDNVMVSAQSGVTSDLEGNKIYSSTLSVEEIGKWRRIQAIIKKLPDIWKRVIKL